MKIFNILFGFLYTVNVMANVKDVFNDWKVKNNKIYETELENRYRFSVFSENYFKIEDMLMLNKFADLTYNEYLCQNKN